MGGLRPRRRQRALGDVLGEVADALQIAGDLQHRHDVAQVVGHGLAPGDHQDGLLLQVALEQVDVAVAGDCRLGELGIAPLQRVEALRQQPLGQAAHLRDLLVELLQLLVEGLDGVLVHGVPLGWHQPERPGCNGEPGKCSATRCVLPCNLFARRFCDSSIR